MTGKRGFSQLPKGKKRRIYSAAFVVVLAAEVAIGIFGRGALRNFLGDVLAVVGVYAAARVVFPERIRAMSAVVTAFAFAVELVQLTDFSALFGEGTLFSVLVGATFDPLDLLCYAIGGALCAVWDIFSCGKARRG